MGSSQSTGHANFSRILCRGAGQCEMPYAMDALFGKETAFEYLSFLLECEYPAPAGIRLHAGCTLVARWELDLLTSYPPSLECWNIQV
jgi:hypothetical protein